MKETLEKLLGAVRATLNNEAYLEIIEEEKPFYLMAKENGFSGMIYPVLNMMQFSEKVKSLFERDFFAYQTQDAKQSVAINDVIKSFNDLGIKHIFLKGSQLKKLYPEPYMRAMGDVDILVEERSMKKIHKVLVASGYKSTTKSDQHDIFEHPNKTPLEIHPRLTRSFRGKDEPLIDQAWNYALLINQSTFKFEPAYECVYLIYHAVKHLYNSGIGLRTILDIGIHLKANIDIINREELFVLLKKSDFTRFFNTILILNKRYFDIDIYPDICNLESLDEDVLNKLTEYIVKSGIHGLGINFNNYVGRVSINKMQNKPKLLFILSLVFPSYKSMRGMYPWLKSLPFLLPIAWGIRILRLVFKKTKRTMLRLKQLNIKKETVEETVDLYKKIGL